MMGGGNFHVSTRRDGRVLGRGGGREPRVTETIVRPGDDAETTPGGTVDASDGAGASWPTLDEQITVLELRSAHRVEPTLKEAEELLATVPEVTEADRARLRLVAAVAHTRLGQIREGLNEVQDVREWAIQADEPLVQARAERDLAMLMRRAGVVHTGLEHAIASVTLL